MNEENKSLVVSEILIGATGLICGLSLIFSGTFFYGAIGAFAGFYVTYKSLVNISIPDKL